MKVTKETLKRIIKEEYNALQQEAGALDLVVVVSENKGFIPSGTVTGGGGASRSHRAGKYGPSGEGGTD